MVFKIIWIKEIKIRSELEKGNKNRNKLNKTYHLQKHAHDLLNKKVGCDDVSASILLIYS